MISKFIAEVNDQIPNIMSMVTILLSFGTIVTPVIFGFAMWKMTQVFVTKEQFNDYKVQSERERHEMYRQLERIEMNVSELLQRTARLMRENE